MVSTLQKDIISIENVQRRATRLVKSVSHLGYADRLRTLGLPTLEYIRERSDMIQVYNIVNNMDKLDMSKFSQWQVTQSPEATQKSCLKTDSDSLPGLTHSIIGLWTLGIRSPKMLLVHPP